MPFPRVHFSPPIKVSAVEAAAFLDWKPGRHINTAQAARRASIIAMIVPRNQIGVPKKKLISQVAQEIKADFIFG